MCDHLHRSRNRRRALFLSLRAALLLIALSSSVTQGAGNWQYGEFRDDVTGETVETASVKSVNSVTFAFPYDGAQRAELTFYKRGNQLTSAVFAIAKGQFICRPGDCSVMVRYDEAEPRLVWATEPTDGSTNYLRLKLDADHLQAMRSAKAMRIFATFYQEGTHTFTFPVSGLEWLPPISRKVEETLIANGYISRIEPAGPHPRVFVRSVFHANGRDEQARLLHELWQEQNANGEPTRDFVLVDDQTGAVIGNYDAATRHLRYTRQ